MKTKEESYHSYHEKLQRWRDAGQAAPDLRTVTSQDVLLVMMSLNRINNRQFVEITLRLIEFIVERGVITSDEVLSNKLCTLPAFYRRMEVLKKANMIRRDSRRYYLATPRLQEFLKQYRRAIQ